MIAIPLYILFILYTLFLATLAVFLLINLYHIIATASFTLVSFLITFFVFASLALVIYGTWVTLVGNEIDWQQPLVLFNGEWLSSLFGLEPASSLE